MDINLQTNSDATETLQEKYNNLQNEYTKLEEKNDNLQHEYTKLQEKYDSLQEKYDSLQEKYDSLQENYSENMIIQSMNDMKIKYEHMIKSSVSIYKYQILEEKFTRLIRCFSGCSVLIDHTIKVLKESKNINFIDKKNLISKAELELITIKEILEDSIILNTE
jgi:predicted nuclease with TOPRIM domain